MATISYNAIYNFDSSIFDELQLPEQLDAETVINNILLESIELEALYPDADIIKKAIGIWSGARLHSWERIADALTKDYDPFVNFKRDEVRTTNYTRNLATDSTNSGKAYNDAEFVEREKAGTNETGGATTVDTFHSEGDSALYTPTDVAEKEVKLRKMFDIVEIITREFIEKFCILVY